MRNILISNRQGATHLESLVSWNHPLGEAHCLGRLIVPASTAAGIVILSEVASNSTNTGVSSDVNGAANSFLEIIEPHFSLSPVDLMWLIHHGDFSSADDWGSPETFTKVKLELRAGRLHENMQQEHLLEPDEIQEYVTPLGLRPVTEVLADLTSHR